MFRSFDAELDREYKVMIIFRIRCLKGTATSCFYVSLSIRIVRSAYQHVPIREVRTCEM
jgi:hypothetical protein